MIVPISRIQVTDTQHIPPQKRLCTHNGQKALSVFPAVLFICLFICVSAFAQNKNATREASPPVKDTSNNVAVHIDNAKFIIHLQTDSGEYTKFVYDVILRQGTDTLYCDSAYENSTTKNFEAFSHVKIAQQGGTKGTCDYLKYTSSQKLAYMRGNVSLTDGKNTLECEELTYNLATKVAVYDNWGTLHNDSTTVTSKTGVYNVSDKNARFKGDVYITDPQYKIQSEDLLYNTESKVTVFYSRSTVTRDNGRSVLRTSDGTYDGKKGSAHFVGHSSIWNDGQYIEADTLSYDTVSGHGLAIGRVISIDTEHHSTMYCGFAEYWQRQRKTLATIKPVLVQANGKDTFYMRADTFYSAPMVKSKHKGPNSLMPADTVANPDTTHISALPPKDTLGKPIKMLSPQKPAKDSANWIIGPPEKPGKTTKKLKKETANNASVTADTEPPGKKKKKKKNGVVEVATVNDTAQADTSAPIYFIGYHHVLLFSDSMQGRCDSICYTRSDSMIRMMYDPIVWSHNSQITGDTILMQLDSSQLRRLYVPNNAFLVSGSGPVSAHLFNQIQGKTLAAYFVNNTISKMIVFPDAQCIYFPQDEKNAYLGLNNATSTRMRIVFENQKINKITFIQDVHTKMTPLEQADIEGAKLGRFKWRMDQRPKTKEELFK